MTTAAATTDENTAARPGDIRVLIVDNDAAHAETVGESLSRVGYDCVVATSGVEGAELVERESFDIVITDLKMNDLDGLELLARTKQALPEAEVILVTRHGTIPSAVAAIQQRAFNYPQN